MRQRRPVPHPPAPRAKRVRLAGRLGGPCTRAVAWGALVFCLFFFNRVQAHAFLKSSSPAEESTVTAELSEVRLEFTEPVEVRFSIFKVYRVNVDPHAEMRRINAAAATLVSERLRTRSDEGERADEGLGTSGRTSASVVLKLKRDLAPGAYVVMWRVLSVDTHTTQGFHVFIYAQQ